MNDRLKYFGTLTLALSIALLAFALFSIAWEANQWRKYLPGLISFSEETANKIAPVFSGPSELDNLVSSILTEISESRKTIDKTVDEIKITREQLPDIIKDVKPIIQQAEVITKELPGIVIPLLEEVKKTREAAPRILDRADQVISNARDIGEEAGKGAAGGFFTGIVTTPFNILGSLGRGAINIFTPEEQEYLTIEDIKIMETTAIEVAENGKIGNSKKWRNKNSSNGGEITLVERYKSGDNECRKLKIETSIKNGETLATRIKGCKQPDGSWEVTEGTMSQ